MKSSLHLRSIFLLAVAAPLTMAAGSQAQSGSGKINPNIPPPPPPSSSAEKPGPSAEKSAPINPDIPPPPPPSAEEKPAKQIFDPIGARKSVEVGQFYLKKGNYDAAIDRFNDATHQNTAYAVPYLMLAETYEKKGDSEGALKAYKTYLRLFPNSPERKRVESRIAELDKKGQSADNKPAS
jgi:tetratricopeptide (TPR) repeat protein